MDGCGRATICGRERAGVTGTRGGCRPTRSAAAPLALARLVIRRAMIEASGGRAVSFAHVEEALRLPGRRGAGRLPGQRVERNGADVVLTGRPEARSGGRQG